MTAFHAMRACPVWRRLRCCPPTGIGFRSGRTCARYGEEFASRSDQEASPPGSVVRAPDSHRAVCRYGSSCRGNSAPDSGRTLAGTGGLFLFLGAAVVVAVLFVLAARGAIDRVRGLKGWAGSCHQRPFPEAVEGVVSGAAGYLRRSRGRRCPPAPGASRRFAGRV